MYTNSDYKFNVRYTDGVVVDVTIPDGEVVYIQLSEYFKNESTPRVIDSSNAMNGDVYNFNRNWYSRYQLDFYRFDNELGMVHIESVSYNEVNKNILFRLDTIHSDEFSMWYDTIESESAIRGFKPTIIHFNEPFDANLYYKIYNVGRFDQNGTSEQHGYPNNFWGLFRYFWSWNQPRDWEHLNSQQIVEDIIGITERDINFRGFIV